MLGKALCRMEGGGGVKNILVYSIFLSAERMGERKSAISSLLVR